MSIWGPAAEQNDDAADWLEGLREGPDVRQVESTIARVRKRKSYLDVDLCAEAVAAAQVLAEACGVPGTKPIASRAVMLAVRRGLQALTKTQVKTLCKDAAAAIATVRDDALRSELHQLWSEDKRRTRWRASLDALGKRLPGAPAALAKLPTVPGAKPKRKAPPEPNLGKVYAIKLPSNRFAYAKGFRGSQFGIYDLISTKILPLDSVITATLAFHVCAIDVAPRRGNWHLVGDEPFESDDDAWGVPTVYGLTNDPIATHLWVNERGITRVVPYAKAIGMTIMAMGNERTTIETIVARLVKKRPPDIMDVVLPKSDPRVT